MKAIASNGVEIKTGDEVLVRDSTNGSWLYCLFSHVNKNEELKYATSFTTCKYCIPYKGNEDLVGTTKNFNEPFKFKFGAKVKAYDGMETKSKNKLGILIDQDIDDSRYKYRVAFQINDNEGRTDWFAKLEYLE